MWHIYILETKDGRLYTGTTNNISRRMAQHKDGRGAKFTRSFGFKELLYTEELLTQSDALKREKQIQSWKRLKKLKLVEDGNKSLKNA